MLFLVSLHNKSKWNRITVHPGAGARHVCWTVHLSLSLSESVCLSVCVICECENWVLCCAALGEVKLHSGASMGATKLHSCHWMAVFYNQALVIPTPLERLYELPLSLPWYARPHPAKTQMVGLTKKDTKHTYMETLRGYVTLHFQRSLSSHPVPNRGLRVSCFLSSLVEPARPWLDFHMSRIIYCHRQDKVQKASFLKQQRFACVEQYRRSHVHHVWWWNIQLCRCARFKPALLSQNAFWEALESRQGPQTERQELLPEG